jgi:predicted MFS family arabinose efflux permease
MKKIAYACCVGVIGIITAEFGVIGILPQIAAYYKINVNTAGLLLSVFSITVALGGPFTTLLSSGFNRKTVMLCSLGLYLISGIVSSLAPPFWLLLIVRALPALLHAVYYSAAISVVIATSDNKDHPRMMAIALSGISIATITTIPLTSYLAVFFSFQYSFIMQAVIIVAGLLSIYCFIPSMPVRKKISYGSQIGILKKPVIWLSLLVTFLMFAAEFSMYGYFADYLLMVKHVSIQGISYLLLLFGVTGLIGNWIAGRILSRSIDFTNIIFIAGCNLVVPLGMYLTGFSTITVSGVVALWGLLYAPGFLIATSSISTAAPEALDFANGMVNSFANFGVTAGTLLAGYVIVHKGMSQIPWLSITFGTFALIFIAAKIILERRVTGNQTRINNTKPSLDV